MKTKFQIGEVVYHPTYDSPSGIIIDFMYLNSKNHIEYLVSRGFNDASWCVEEELTLEKTVI